MTDETARGNQYRRRENCLKTIDDGCKMYDPLVKRPEEEVLWKEFKAHFDEWTRKEQAVLDHSCERDKLVKAGAKAGDAKVEELDAKVLTELDAFRASFDKANETLEELLKLTAKDSDDAMKQAEADATSSVVLIFSAIGLGSLLMVALGVILARSISKVLTALIGEATRLSTAAIEGKLQTRGNPELVTLEFRPIVEGVNATLDAVIGPLNVAAEYVDRISKGDIPTKITDTYNGDFNEIKNNLNQCIDAVNAMSADAVMLARAAVEGKLQTRADAATHQGDFRKIVQGVNDTLDAVIGPINNAATALKAMAAKDFTRPIEGDYAGDFKAPEGGRQRGRGERPLGDRPDHRERQPVRRGLADDCRERPNACPGGADAERQRRANDGLDRGTGPQRRVRSRRTPTHPPRWRRRPTNWPTRGARRCRSRSSRWSRSAPARSRSARSSR